MTQTEPSNPEDAIRVLHVDDEQSQLKFTKSFVNLSDSTIHMESVLTPEAALRRLEEENFDCIVSDYQMPVLNGIELARRIRGFSDVPIIIYTGRGSEEVASKAFAAGIDDYMRKEIEPSHYEVLARRIRAAVEKHLYERRLGESVNQFRVLFDGIPEAILLIDPKDYTIIRANKAAFEHPWNEEVDVIGRPCYEVTHQRSSPCEPSDYPCPIRELLESGKSAVDVHLHHDMDGNELYFEVSAFPILDDDGRIVNVVHCSRNISVKRRMEMDLLLVNQLNESVNRGDGLQEIVGQLARETGRNFSCYGSSVYLVSEDGEHLVLQNQTLPQPLLSLIEKLIGRSIPKVEIPLKPGSLYSEILGLNSPQIIQEPDSIRRLIADCTENVVLKRLAPQIYSALGIKSVIVAPLVSEGETIGLLDLSRSKRFGELDLERIKHIASQVASIIKRKKIEGDLFLERDKAQRYLELANVILVALDAEGKVTLLNKHGCELLGWNEGEAVGRDWFESFIPERNRDEVKRVFGKLLSSDLEPVEYYENSVLTINGEERLIGWYNTLLRDLTGEITGILSSGIDITERKKMEEELRERDAERQAILDTMKDPMSLKDREYRYIWVNRVLADSIGETPEELVGKICYEALYERIEPCVGCSMDQVFETGKSSHDIVFGDDGRIHDSYLEPVMDESGKVRHVLETFRDITERMQYFDRLETIYQHASKLSGADSLEEVAGVTLGGIEDTFGFRNMSFSFVDGDELRPVEIRGDTPPTRTRIPLDGDGIIAKVARTGETINLPDVRDDPEYFEARPSTRSELTVPVKVDGITVAVINIESSEVNAFSLEDQRLVEIFAEHVVSAIRRMKKIERLKASEERYRTVLESGMDGTAIVVDRDYVYVNDTFAEMLGYSDSSELIGRRSSEIVDPRDAERLDEIVQRRKDGENQRLIYQLRVMKKDGSSIWLEVSSIGTEFEGKRATISNSRDITDRKRMEEKLKQHSEHLEELVKEKTMELSVSEERLRSFIASAPDAFTLYDSELNCLDVNEALLKYWPEGTTKEDLIGKNMLGMDPDIKETGRYDRYLDVIKTGQPFQIEEITLHPVFGEAHLSLKAKSVRGWAS